MDNEGVPGGNLEKITEVFSHYPTDILKKMIQAHSEGGKWAEKCTSSPIIVSNLTSILSQRGE